MPRLAVLVLIIFITVACVEYNASVYLEGTKWIRFNEMTRKEIWEFCKNGQLKVYPNTESYVDSLVEEIGRYKIISPSDGESNYSHPETTLEIEGSGGYLAFIRYLRISKLRDDEMVCITDKNKSLEFGQLYDEKIAGMFEDRKRVIHLPQNWSNKIAYRRISLVKPVSASENNNDTPDSNMQSIFQKLIPGEASSISEPSQNIKEARAKLIQYHHTVINRQKIVAVWHQQKRNVFIHKDGETINLKRYLTTHKSPEIDMLVFNQSFQVISNRISAIQAGKGQVNHQPAYFLKYHLKDGTSLIIMQTQQNQWMLVYFE